MDAELIEAAGELIAARGDDRNHTVGAAARAGDGRIVSAVNLYHFTGGPCAEMVVLARAVSEGVDDLREIVAIGDRDRGIMPPCGRCRQVMLDYFPEIRVIVPTEDGPSAVPIGRLLPYGYRRTSSGSNINST